MRKAIFQLEPLTCPSCVKKIEGAFAKTEGVTSAKVLFNLGRVKAEFDSSVVEAKQLENTLEKLGFPVISTKVS